MISNQSRYHYSRLGVLTIFLVFKEKTYKTESSNFILLKIHKYFVMGYLVAVVIRLVGTIDRQPQVISLRRQKTYESQTPYSGDAAGGGYFASLYSSMLRSGHGTANPLAHPHASFQD